jgi:hypothetical protein
MHLRNCASRPAQPSWPYPWEAQQSIRSGVESVIDHLRGTRELWLGWLSIVVCASTKPIVVVTTPCLFVSQVFTEHILSMEDMTVTQAFCSFWFGRRTRRWLMVFKRSGFNRVVTLPLGAMAKELKGIDSRKRLR